METKFTAKYLAYLAPFASNNPTRYYLNGVFVEPAPQGGVFIVATDGNKLAAIHDPDGTVPDGGILIKTCKETAYDPRPMIRACKKSDGIFTLENGTATVDGVGYSSPDMLIDGTFPDWKRVVPESPTGEQDPNYGFNSSYLAAFNVTGTAKSPDIIRIHHNGTGPALVRNDSLPELLGVVMPCKIVETAAFPQWFNESRTLWMEAAMAKTTKAIAA